MVQPETTSEELCDREAVALKRMLSEGSISARDLLESCIGRIEACNEVLNAVVTDCFDEARQASDLADRLSTEERAHAPLHGIPVLIKDLIATKGMRTTYGSLCFESNVPDEDAEIVRRLRRAGAIILGKTNTPEFGAGANTFNDVFGATCNPFDPSLTCGGSSGGSAVAVATGMAPLAIGSDFGGSLRIPASFCSVVGMRPSTGLVPSTDQTLAHSPLWTEGPMARTASDAALCLSAIAGAHRQDPRSGAEFRPHGGASVDLRTLRVGFSSDLGIATVDENIRTIFEERASDISRFFGQRSDVVLDLNGADRVFDTTRIKDILAHCGSMNAKAQEMLGDNIRSTLQRAATLTISDAAEVERMHGRITRAFQQIFEEVDILICPATVVSPFPVTERFPTTINGEPLSDYFSWYAVTWALSLTGCPVLAIPCGTDHRGMPFGIQIVGPRLADADVLSITQALEERLEENAIGRRFPDRSIRS